MTLEEYFIYLKDKWLYETNYISSSTVIANNEYYQRIISFGESVLPFIFKDLQETHHHWFEALNQITGEQPVDEKYWGNISKMSEIWLEWGKQNNYI